MALYKSDYYYYYYKTENTAQGSGKMWNCGIQMQNGNRAGVS